MQRIITCIECPRGCTLTVNVNETVTVDGNFCPKGKAYGINEVTCPKRVVTGTVRADGQMIPVKTDRSVKKSEIFTVMKKILSFRLLTNVSIGDIIIENVDGEGTNLVATAPYVKGE